MNTLKTMGSLIGAIDPNENFQFDPNFDEFGDYVNRSPSILHLQFHQFTN